MKTITQTVATVEAVRAYITARIEINERGCWIWQRARDVDGYGRAWIRPIEFKAHRLAYEAWRDPIPDGLYACHKCDVPACCNPEHIFIGTMKDNHSDRDSKGRNADVRGDRNPCAKLTWDKVREIRTKFVGVPQSKVAVVFGVSQATISMVRNGKAWVEE